MCDSYIGLCLILRHTFIHRFISGLRVMFCWYAGTGCEFLLELSCHTWWGIKEKDHPKLWCQPIKKCLWTQDMCSLHPTRCFDLNESNINLCIWTNFFQAEEFFTYMLTSEPRSCTKSPMRFWVYLAFVLSRKLEDSHVLKSRWLSFGYSQLTWLFLCRNT